MNNADLYMLTVMGLLVYFVPALVAGLRSHHQGGAIFVLNLLLGWTLIGWVCALVWACTQVRPPVAAVAGAGWR